jgi:hypothetical protein
MITHAFSAMQAVWELTPSSMPPLPVAAARSRKGAPR